MNVVNVLWRLVSRVLECLECARNQARRTRELRDGDTARDYRPEEA